jgi:hypothetical protein
LISRRESRVRARLFGVVKIGHSFHNRILRIFANRDTCDDPSPKGSKCQNHHTRYQFASMPSFIYYCISSRNVKSVAIFLGSLLGYYGFQLNWPSWIIKGRFSAINCIGSWLGAWLRYTRRIGIAIRIDPLLVNLTAFIYFACH